MSVGAPIPTAGGNRAVEESDRLVGVESAAATRCSTFSIVRRLTWRSNWRLWSISDRGRRPVYFAEHLTLPIQPGEASLRPERWT